MQHPLDIGYFKERQDRLPIFSPLAHQLLELLDDPDLTTGDLRDLVRLDGPLTMRVINGANSALFSGLEPAAELAEAIDRLGRRQLRTLIITSTLFDLFPEDESLFPLVEYWRRAAANGIVGERVADATSLPNPSRAWLFGVVQDVGRLLYAHQAPEETRLILQLAREHGLSFDDAASHITKLTSSELSAWACAQWKLPQWLVDLLYAAAARRARSTTPLPIPGLHEKTASLIESPFFAIAHVADHICHLHGISLPGDFQQRYQIDAHWRKLNLNVDAFVALYQAAEPSLRDLNEIMQTFSDR